jgi:hypothetical protein
MSLAVRRLLVVVVGAAMAIYGAAALTGEWLGATPWSARSWWEKIEIRDYATQELKDPQSPTYVFRHDPGNRILLWEFVVVGSCAVALGIGHAVLDAVRTRRRWA